MNVALSVRALCVACTLSGGASDAQTWTHEFSVETRSTATTNANLAAHGQAQKDLVLDVQPRLRFGRHSAGLLIVGDTGLDIVDYVGHSQVARALPRVRVDAQASLVERLLFVDAAVDARQVERDPFGLRPADGSSSNSQTSTSLRISPYLKTELLPRTTLQARFDESFARESGNAAAKRQTQTTTVNVVRLPQPLGASLDASSQRARFGDGVGGEFDVDALRGSVDLGFGVDGQVSLVVGREKTSLLLASSTDSVYGVRGRWEPTPRTQLSADFEHRFFGNGWDISLRHRTPSMSISLRTEREPSISTSSLGFVPAGVSVGSYLDAILTARYPDPAERAAVVDGILTGRGLQSSVPEAINLLATYAQLRTGAEGTIVILGSRNTVSVSAYVRTLRQLVRTNDILTVDSSVAADSRQVGGFFEFNRKLTPQTTLDVSMLRSAITGLAARLGDRSTETSYRLSWTRSLTPRTDTTVGAQWTLLKTTVVGVPSYDVASAFVGLRHRF